MWFAVSLVRKGLITPEQFVDATEYRLKRRIPIGRLAIETRKMTMAQVFHVLNVQADRPQPFGEIAVEMGHLSPESLALLLMEQADRDLSMEDALLAINAVSRETLEAERIVLRGQKIDVLSPATV